MWFSAAVLVSLLGVVVCRPPIVTPYGNFSTDPISPEDRRWIEKHSRSHRAAYPPGFKFMYVSQDGQIAPDRRPDGHYVRIVGSPQTAKESLYNAALQIYKMMRYAPVHIFNGVADSEGGLGLFTAAEKLTVYPSLKQFADRPECHNRCDGACSNTCLVDGRKIENVAGVGSVLAVILEDNVICSARDPYGHIDNGLVHEFTHQVERHGLNNTEKAQNYANFNNAKARRLWNPKIYAMLTEAEYLGEATGAFFLVNLQTGGMTDCSYGLCKNEMEARNVIRSRDPNLYNFLVYMWTNGRVTETKIMKILTDVPNLRITQRAGEGLNDPIMLANVLLVVRELSSPTRYPETKSEWDRYLLERQTLTHPGSYPPGFKFMYVSQDGRTVSSQKPATGHFVKIVGNPRTSKEAMYV